MCIYSIIERRANDLNVYISPSQSLLVCNSHQHSSTFLSGHIMIVNIQSETNPAKKSIPRISRRFDRFWKLMFRCHFWPHSKVRLFLTLSVQGSHAPNWGLRPESPNSSWDAPHIKIASTLSQRSDVPQNSIQAEACLSLGNCCLPRTQYSHNISDYADYQCRMSA